MKTFRQLIQYDAELGHKYVPNQFARLRYGNDGYFIETDQNGFRNSSMPLESCKTILLLGDSFSAGDGVCNPERFSDLIAAELNCKVVNLAVSGFGVDQQLLVYEQYKDRIPHDAVILAPHLDDIKRNLLESREGIDKSSGQSIRIPKPYFTLQNGSLKLNNVPVPRTRTASPKVSKATTRHHTLHRAKKYIAQRILKKQIHPELSQGNSPEWKLMHRILDRLKEAIGNKPLFLVPIPYYDSITYKEDPFYLKEFQKHANENVSVIDVASALNALHNIENDTIFLPLCGHFTVNGHRIIADILKSTLQDRLSIEDRPTTTVDPHPEKSLNEFVLGISCFYHDSAAALIKNGEVIAAAQEERFTRVKHDKSFPLNAINYCLEEGKIAINNVSAVVYYDMETWTIERVLHNALAIEQSDLFWEKAQKSLFPKLKLPSIIRKSICYTGPIFKTQHHVSHAAGAFFPSPFQEAAILVIDGVGEWACSTIAVGNQGKIEILKQQHYPHSLGLLYSAMTYFCGFKVNSGEYKLMGLAPYGSPIYVDIIKQHLVTIKQDGSIHLNLAYFSFLEGERMTNDKFAQLFGGPERTQESPITRREMDLAASIQSLTEEIAIKMANHAYALTGKKHLVMSGGVALNCVSNGKLYDHTPFEDFYFQPASGDAGGAIGCALNWYFEQGTAPRKTNQPNAYLGPSFSDEETLAYLESKGVPYHLFSKNTRSSTIAQLLTEKNIIGYFDGRMEFGPRALGNRSIIANPMDVEMQSKLNLKIKFRESFRPFAPIYAEERTKDYFDFDRPSPYMLVVRNVKKELLVEPKLDQTSSDNMIDIVNQKRSELPAITHVDNSARLQSVNSNQNPRFHEILMEFEKKTGKAVLINTSFNVRGEPIVCTLNDAYKCFMRTNMDVLVLNNVYLIKTEQPEWTEIENWQETFELD